MCEWDFFKLVFSEFQIIWIGKRRSEKGRGVVEFKVHLSDPVICRVASLWIAGTRMKAALFVK